jgi:hypothetical protein
MTSARRAAYAVALVASCLLVAGLFLDWQTASVRVSGVVGLEASSSGWDGAGLLAGLAAIVVVAVSIVSLSGRREHPRTLLAAALTALIATVLATFSGSADVVVPGVEVAVVVDATRWPAWVGLGLAVLTSAAALIAYGSQAPTSSADSARGTRASLS